MGIARSQGLRAQQRAVAVAADVGIAAARVRRRRHFARLQHEVVRRAATRAVIEARHVFRAAVWAVSIASIELNHRHQRRCDRLVLLGLAQITGVLNFARFKNAVVGNPAARAVINAGFDRRATVRTVGIAHRQLHVGKQRRMHRRLRRRIRTHARIDRRLRRTQITRRRHFARLQDPVLRRAATSAVIDTRFDLRATVLTMRISDGKRHLRNQGGVGRVRIVVARRMRRLHFRALERAVVVGIDTRRDHEATRRAHRRIRVHHAGDRLILIATARRALCAGADDNAESDDHQQATKIRPHGDSLPFEPRSRPRPQPTRSFTMEHLRHQPKSYRAKTNQIESKMFIKARIP